MFVGLCLLHVSMLVKLPYVFKGKGITEVCAIRLQHGGEHTLILKKKGVLQLALQFNFCVSHYIYNSLYLYIVSAIEQITWVT